MQALRAALSGLEMASTPQDKHRRLLEADERLTELEQLLEQKDCMIDQLRREQAIMQQHTAELHSQITVFKSEREEWKAVVERLNGELERFKEQCEQQVRRREVRLCRDRPVERREERRRLAPESKARDRLVVVRDVARRIQPRNVRERFERASRVSSLEGIHAERLVDHCELRLQLPRLLEKRAACLRPLSVDQEVAAVRE